MEEMYGSAPQIVTWFWGIQDRSGFDTLHKWGLYFLDKYFHSDKMSTLTNIFTRSDLKPFSAGVGRRGRWASFSLCQHCCHFPQSRFNFFPDSISCLVHQLSWSIHYLSIQKYARIVSKNNLGIHPRILRLSMHNMGLTKCLREGMKKTFFFKMPTGGWECFSTPPPTSTLITAEHPTRTAWPGGTQSRR